MPEIAEKLNVLVIGNGGREHAICWKLAQSPHVQSIYCAPGNGGTAKTQKTANVPDLTVMDFAGQVKLCQEKKINFVVVGPDDPIAAGAVDYLENAGLRVFGPRKQAALLESSKVFAKEFMVANRIPTARYMVSDNLQEALDLVNEHPWARVIKVDGLALGKGVFVCDTAAEAASALHTIFRERKFGDAGKRVLLEEKLCGEELSLLMFCDGKRLEPMPPSQDHKRRFEGDRGPNTGGMGAYSPVDLYKYCRDEIDAQVLEPLRKALNSRTLAYQGVLYIGLMIHCHRDADTGSKTYQPYVLEFNARFGDPETQTLLPLLKSDLAEVLWACTEGKLASMNIEWQKAASCCVVACAQTYPESSSKGEAITIDESKLPQGAYVFHAGTKVDDAGNASVAKVVTNGGRVLAVTAVGESIEKSIDLAYEGLNHVSFAGMDYRKDIARRAGTACLSA